MFQVTRSPKFYHYRNKNESDRDWVLHRMTYIPIEIQEEVANNYEKLFLAAGGGRRAANTYLNYTAKEQYKIHQKERANG